MAANCQNIIPVSKFIELAGGKLARIVVVPAMAVDQRELATYREPWTGYDIRLLTTAAIHGPEPMSPNFRDPRFRNHRLVGQDNKRLAGWYGGHGPEIRMKNCSPKRVAVMEERQPERLWCRLLMIARWLPNTL